MLLEGSKNNIVLRKQNFIEIVSYESYAISKARKLILLSIISFRVFVGKLQPPVVPFMPLLLKDMTFAHEGNKTSLDGLVNFEKMHMMAQTMRTIRFCRSRHLGMC